MTAVLALLCLLSLAPSTITFDLRYHFGTPEAALVTRRDRVAPKLVQQWDKKRLVAPWSNQNTETAHKSDDREPALLERRMARKDALCSVHHTWCKKGQRIFYIKGKRPRIMVGVVELSHVTSSTMLFIGYIAISLAYAAMAQNLEWCGNQRYSPNQVKNSH